MSRAGRRGGFDRPLLGQCDDVGFGRLATVEEPEAEQDEPAERVAQGDLAADVPADLRAVDEPDEAERGAGEAVAGGPWNCLSMMNAVIEPRISPARIAPPPNSASPL